MEIDDDKIVAELPSPPPEEKAVLRSFQTQQTWGKQPALYAYQNDGGMVSVQSAERISKGGRTVWKLTLMLDRGERRNLMTEISFNGITPLQIAEMRARLLLLNEKPQSPKGASRDSMLELGIAGISNSLKIKEGIFPELWKRFQGSPELFSEFARLWAVFYLKASSARWIASRGGVEFNGTGKTVLWPRCAPPAHGAPCIQARRKNRGGKTDFEMNRPIANEG